MKVFLITALVFLLLSTETNGQSISGRNSLNVASKSESIASKEMTYGNVEVFDMENNLVASVITDQYGNYNLKLSDTGTYRIKIMYAGYKTKEETIKVKGDVINNISLDRDKGKKQESLIREVLS